MRTLTQKDLIKVLEGDHSEFGIYDIANAEEEGDMFVVKDGRGQPLAQFHKSLVGIVEKPGGGNTLSVVLDNCTEELPEDQWLLNNRTVPYGDKS